MKYTACLILVEKSKKIKPTVVIVLLTILMLIKKILNIGSNLMIFSHLYYRRCFDLSCEVKTEQIDYRRTKFNIEKLQ